MKITEGQLDFLGLLNEYTDEQGAMVRVREPGRGPNKHAKEEKGGTTVKDASKMEPLVEQLSFVEKISGDISPERKTVKVTVPPRIDEKAVTEKSGKAVPYGKDEPVTSKEDVAVISEKDLPVTDEKGNLVINEKGNLVINEKENLVVSKKEKLATIENGLTSENEQGISQNLQAVKKPEKKVSAVIPKVTPKETNETVINKDDGLQKEILFKQCKKCWCFDCKHNSRNDGIPREMCGMMMPCPACDGCISEDTATICEIGNAKEGCKLRALEEGIVVPEEME